MKQQQEHNGKAHLSCEIGHQKMEQKAWVTERGQHESTASFSLKAPRQTKTGP